MAQKTPARKHEDLSSNPNNLNKRPGVWGGRHTDRSLKIIGQTALSNGGASGSLRDAKEKTKLKPGNLVGHALVNLVYKESSGPTRTTQ